MANHVTPFEAAEGVNRENFNLRISEMNTAISGLEAEIDGINTALEGSGGGFGENLLDNWYFPSANVINQYNRSVNSAFSTVNSYFIDRWLLVSGSVTLTTAGLVLNGTIRQKLENLPGVAVAASVYASSGTAAAAYNSGGYVDVSSSGGTVVAVKLEQGSKQTLMNAAGALQDPRPNKAEQLARCQRFYFCVTRGVAWEVVGIGRSGSAGTLSVNIPVPVTMRANPAVTYSGSWRILTDSGTITNITSMSLGNRSNNIIRIDVKSSSVADRMWGELQSTAAGSHLIFNINL